MARLQDSLYPVPNPVSGAAGYRLAVSSSPVQLSAGLSYHGDTKYIFIDVQNQDVIVTFDGSTPSTSNGHVLSVGYRAFWHVNTARAAKFIRAGGSDGAVHASQFSY